jgi:hypothetical protein
MPFFPPDVALVDAKRMAFWFYYGFHGIVYQVAELKSKRVVANASLQTKTRSQFQYHSPGVVGLATAGAE